MERRWGRPRVLSTRVPSALGVTAIVGHHGFMVAIAWALFAALVATLGVLTASLHAGLGRIDSLGARIDAQGDSLGARIETLGAKLDARLDAQTSRIDALTAEMHVEFRELDQRLRRSGV
jgi:hypothetical protein